MSVCKKPEADKPTAMAGNMVIGARRHGQTVADGLQEWNMDCETASMLWSATSSCWESDRGCLAATLVDLRGWDGIAPNMHGRLLGFANMLNGELC